MATHCHRVALQVSNRVTAPQLPTLCFTAVPRDSLGELARENISSNMRSYFFTAAGDVLVMNDDGDLSGAVGATRDTGVHEELCALAGITAAGPTT